MHGNGDRRVWRRLPDCGVRPRSALADRAGRIARQGVWPHRVCLERSGGTIAVEFRGGHSDERSDLVDSVRRAAVEGLGSPLEGDDMSAVSTGAESAWTGFRSLT